MIFKVFYFLKCSVQEVLELVVKVELNKIDEVVKDNLALSLRNGNWFNFYNGCRKRDVLEKLLEIRLAKNNLHVPLIVVVIERLCFKIGVPRQLVDIVPLNLGNVCRHTNDSALDLIISLERRKDSIDQINLERCPRDVTLRAPHVAGNVDANHFVALLYLTPFREP